MEDEEEGDEGEGEDDKTLIELDDLDDHDKEGDYLYIAKLDNTQISEDTIEGKV